MNQEYIQDIQDIRTIMASRSRFLSLSGLSGILSGIYALVGAYVAYGISVSSESMAYQDLKYKVSIIIYYCQCFLTSTLISKM